VNKSLNEATIVLGFYRVLKMARKLKSVDNATAKAIMAANSITANVIHLTPQQLKEQKALNQKRKKIETQREKRAREKMAKATAVAALVVVDTTTSIAEAVPTAIPLEQTTTPSDDVQVISEITLATPKNHLLAPIKQEPLPETDASYEAPPSPILSPATPTILRWTFEMHQALGEHLLEAVSKGLQTDGGFKPDVFTDAVKIVKPITPPRLQILVHDSRIRGKWDTAKMKWKHWGDHLKSTASGWSVTAEGLPYNEPQVMDDYFEAYPDRSTFRHSMPPMYAYMDEILGERMATGDEATGVAAAIREMAVEAAGGFGFEAEVVDSDSDKADDTVASGTTPTPSTIVLDGYSMVAAGKKRIADEKKQKADEKEAERERAKKVKIDLARENLEARKRSASNKVNALAKRSKNYEDSDDNFISAMRETMEGFTESMMSLQRVPTAPMTPVEPVDTDPLSRAMVVLNSEFEELPREQYFELIDRLQIGSNARIFLSVRKSDRTHFVYRLLGLNVPEVDG
jgi:hypothetical protein